MQYSAHGSSEVIYPFSAIVGQESMKRALILAAIHPGLGGVLIRGSKGAAKSTAVRALAALLPDIDVVPGDPFRRAPGEEVAGWPIDEGAAFARRAVSLVNLPVGATDDRVVGSLNLERALSTGSRAFEPGLLAAAHRGILYIDEVNLLGDHLVDLLLDAAAMGVNHVEREGLTFRHPARFVLIGTMNPEEGDLRPQLLDRFGLAVEVESMGDPKARAEVVRRRLAFESDPEAFRARWADADRLEGERIARAQGLLPSVVVPDPVLAALCARCAREGADGLRADLTIYKAASALAAHEGRTVVTHGDVDAVAELALAHRRTHHSPPQPPPPAPRQNGDDSERSQSTARPEPSPSRERREQTRGENVRAEDEAEPTGPPDKRDDPEVIPAAEPRSAPSWKPNTIRAKRSTVAGRRGRLGSLDRRGPMVRAAVPRGRCHDPALVATLRAAALWQQCRGRATDAPLIVRPVDLRDKVRMRPARHLILFVVDASRSMGARKRMAQTKAAVLSLLVDAYQKRDRVGLITFGGSGAQLVLAPTRSVHVAARELQELPIGGATPLAHGLVLASQVIAAARRREPGLAPFVVLLTDGRGNVALGQATNPGSDALGAAARLARSGVTGMVIDTEAGPIRLGRARNLAIAWGAELADLDDLAGATLSNAVRHALFSRTA